ncbi:DNA methyltransferase [Schaalia sp. lx-260]|uniref:DNA methyltransferase n=1 Tax=Schaalia sp. lx-260 TaxID=2899082 RepID=UPI001E616304|nr:DNA methyltransferase [Schaalia sp. lx-260]MCD4549926.1 N-6 DNA methylase [Schaalia sp. lx-260]
MARLNLKAIEERVKPLGNHDYYDREFIYDLLLAYGKPKSSITRLRSGAINVAEDPVCEVAQKNVVYFKESPDDSVDLLLEIERLRTAAHVKRYTPRFIIVTDYVEMLAWDMKTGENLIIPLRDIAKHFTFFLPWAGMEKTQYVAEAHADVKAAEQMGKLFDELLHANPELLDHPERRHGLNVFFTRLLFCYFAEDTGIFAPNQFTNAVGSQTLEDGSDTQEFLTDLFEALDTATPEDKPSHLQAFPYVNGRLFSKDQSLTVPVFTKQARTMLINLGKLIWQEINPDIFGSMFQAIVTPGKRSDLGQHYTSVPNILKTIEPLFLDELREEFDANYDKAKQLEKLLERISQIKVFDPACGSGNFLVIAYKELRKLEHSILERLADLNPAYATLFTDSKISIENFFGIEIDDFAVEVAILSLWIAKHQMNQEFKEKFGTSIPLIPLKETGHIRAGNAARIEWSEVCPNNGRDELYLIGNPPYVGSSMQDSTQKADFIHVFKDQPFSKKLDYVTLWIIKGAQYIKGTEARLAFVTTNSITQGEHVGLLFPSIFEMGIEIGYAYTSFKWQNNAKHNAGVSVVVMSLRNASSAAKFLFQDDLRVRVKNISPYLSDNSNVVVTSRPKPIARFMPQMLFGSKPTDGGHLILSEQECRDLLAMQPEAARFIKKYCGSNEFINGKLRHCIWVQDDEVSAAAGIAELKRRFKLVSESRLASKKQATQALEDVPYRFAEPRYKPTDSIIVPRVSSERREYIPIGYLGSDTVISDSAYAVYDAQPWLFALLTSRIHMVWTRAVGGKMKTDYRYSNTIVYNNFPVPPLSEHVKQNLTELAFRVLDVREYYCECTLAELYDPDRMPLDLREAHAAIDVAVDRIYRQKPFESDEERLSMLFALYEQLIEEERIQLEAVKPTKKPRRSRKVQA